MRFNVIESGCNPGAVEAPSAGHLSFPGLPLWAPPSYLLSRRCEVPRSHRLKPLSVLTVESPVGSAQTSWRDVRRDPEVTFYEHVS